MSTAADNTCPVEACRVLQSRLIKGSGFFGRDFTVYEVVSKTAHGTGASVSPNAYHRRWRPAALQTVLTNAARWPLQVEKRFSEFEAFHTSLEPALASAVAAKRAKAQKLMDEARRAMQKVRISQRFACWLFPSCCWQCPLPMLLPCAPAASLRWTSSGAPID